MERHSLMFEEGTNEADRPTPNIKTKYFRKEFMVYMCDFLCVYLVDFCDSYVFMNMSRCKRSGHDKRESDC